MTRMTRPDCAVMCNLINTHTHNTHTTHKHTHIVSTRSNTGNWETMAVKAEVWVEAVTKGGRRFMAAWREEEQDAARHRQEKREATRLGKLQSHTEA